MHDEIFEPYLRGQLGRRAFIRRLVAGGVSLVAAVSYADVLTPRRAEALEGSNFYDQDFYGGPDVYVSNAGFNPSEVTVSLGRFVNWRFGNSGTPHAVVDATGLGLFDSGTRYFYGDEFGQHTWRWKFRHAGSYPYRCHAVPGDHMSNSVPTGVVHVPVGLSQASAPLGTPVTVTWLVGRIGGGDRSFDVIWRAVGAERWKRLATDSREASAVLQPPAPGRYEIRARLQAPSAFVTSDWSPPRGLRVTEA